MKEEVTESIERRGDLRGGERLKETGRTSKKDTESG